MNRLYVVSSHCDNEWVTERLIQLICSLNWFIQKWSKWLHLWMSHWLTQFVQKHRFIQKRSDWIYEWVIESLTHSIRSNAWFIQKQSKLPSWWMSHWIIDSLNLFKWLIYSEPKPVTLFMNVSLNHWLTQFVQKCRFIQKKNDCSYKWLTESLTHSIRSKT